MADGYSRVLNRQGVCIAQNGPGITNFVTAIAAAYWAHSPVVVITPETGTATIGHGGFQETEQLPIFSKITKYQAHVDAARTASPSSPRAASTSRSPSAGRRSSTSRATCSTARYDVHDPEAEPDRALGRRREEPRRGGESCWPARSSR